MENREIKFEYVWQDSKTKHIIREVWDIDQISNRDCYETFADAPLHRNYRLIAKRQFTGLTDKNKKEIYEGDILQTGISKAIGIVGFKDGSFCWENRMPQSCVRHTDIKGCEVIGNIYQNPEICD